MLVPSALRMEGTATPEGTRTGLGRENVLETLKNRTSTAQMPRGSDTTRGHPRRSESELPTPKFKVPTARPWPHLPSLSLRSLLLAEGWAKQVTGP